VSLFRQALGEAFDTLPQAVRQVHGAEQAATFAGSGRARGSRNPLLAAGRAVLGLPRPGRHREISVTVRPDPRGECWRRTFSGRRFASRLGHGRATGQFEEAFGPLRFAFRAEPAPAGFTWRLVAWRLGPLALPLRHAPRLKARIHESDGLYRFSAVAAHPWFGVLFAYAGRLHAVEPPTPGSAGLE
jgi:hypothetical protein